MPRPRPRSTRRSVCGALVIPYGGGTSVVGHLRVPEGDRPVVNISLERLAALQAVDAQNLTARFGAGAPGRRSRRRWRRTA